MPSLNYVQKETIAQRLRDGVTIRAIANELRVNKNTVLLAKRKIEAHGRILRIPGSGRPRITTANNDLELTNFLRENPFDTVVSARQETFFPASLKTARRRVRETELRNRCATNKIFLTDENKLQRVLFAQQYINEPANIWDNVVFSDEKTFQSCNNGHIRTYRPSGTRYDERYVHKYNKSGRFSANVWGWISSRGPGVCLIIEDRLTALVYKRVLQDVMLPSVRPVFDQENFTFQHVSVNLSLLYLTYFNVLL